MTMPQLIDWEYNSNSKLIAVTVDDDGDGVEEFELVRHGRWIEQPSQVKYVSHWQCSVCSSWQGVCWMNYCPHCGAKMDGGDGM
jgi:hypothetical protein